MTPISRPRVGLIVDGESEFRALPDVLRRMAVGSQVVKTLRADIQPLSTAGAIARAVTAKLGILAALRVDRAVILFDREQRAECPSELSDALRKAVARCCPHFSRDLSVVVKDRVFENWLVADLDALGAMPKRFAPLAARAVTAIQSGRADALDGLREIKGIARNGDYDKVPDSIAVLRKADVSRLGKGSRSFRRLLRILEHPDYLTQSKRPA